MSVDKIIKIVVASSLLTACCPQEGSDVQYLPSWARKTPSVQVLTGRVVDSDGRPVSGARIVDADHNVGVATDEEGRFSLLLPAKGCSFTVMADGYNDSCLDVPPVY